MCIAHSGEITVEYNICGARANGVDGLVRYLRKCRLIYLTAIENGAEPT